MTRTDFAYDFRRTGGKDFAATLTSLWAEVDDPVGCLDYVQVVLNHYDGIAVIGQTVQDFEQHFDILKMQAGRGFVENVQRAARVTFGQFQRQFDTLGFSAGERCR